MGAEFFWESGPNSGIWYQIDPPLKKRQVEGCLSGGPFMKVTMWMNSMSGQTVGGILCCTYLGAVLVKGKHWDKPAKMIEIKSEYHTKLCIKHYCVRFGGKTAPLHLEVALAFLFDSDIINSTRLLQKKTCPLSCLISSVVFLRNQEAPWERKH